MSFQYLRDTPEFETARSEGFKEYIGIPMDRNDTSDAINTLGRRLLNPERPDYAGFLERFGLSIEHNLPTLSLLAYTGAKLTSDSFSVADTFEDFDRNFQYIFDVTGRRHAKTHTPSPQVGDTVIFRAEPQNQHDEFAVELFDADENRFGYINSCQAKAVNQWFSEGSITGQVFRENGRIEYSCLFVIANITPSMASQAA